MTSRTSYFSLSPDTSAMVSWTWPEEQYRYCYTYLCFRDMQWRSKFGYVNKVQYQSALGSERNRLRCKRENVDTIPVWERQSCWLDNAIVDITAARQNVLVFHFLVGNERMNWRRCFREGIVVAIASHTECYRWVIGIYDSVYKLWRYRACLDIGDSVSNPFYSPNTQVFIKNVYSWHFRKTAMILSY